MLLWITSTGKHIIIIVNFLLIAAFASRFYFDRVLSDLNESIKVKEEIIKSQAPFEKKFKSLQKQLTDIKKISADQEAPYATITELTALTPPNVKLSNFALSKKSLSFGALAPSKEVLKSFVDNLNTSKIFQNIEIKNVSKTSLKDQSIRAEFLVTLLI